MSKFKEHPSAREIFGRNLRCVRRFKEMTQEQLALQAGVARGYLSRVEHGAINISIDNADALALAVGTPLRDLVDPTKFSTLDEPATAVV